MAYKKSETISGIVTIPIQCKRGKSSTYARFSIQDLKENSFISCLAFGEMAENLQINYTPNIKLILHGNYDEKKIFIVRNFQIEKEKGAEPIIDLNLRIAGSPQRLEQMRNEIKAQNIGCVLVRWGDILAWQDKNLCIEVNGTWYHKLYYCQELLGDTYVNRKCREFTKSEGGLLKINRENYLKFLGELVDEAEGKPNPEGPSDDLTVAEGEIL